ncbi:MAG: hypothetical protein C7K11_08050 [Candidatus Amulumruptor caecigallinarius]|uniref:Helix-turn-helix domain-containing protein n=1 Tax=Candidatus Amulumruptor caecigallinarius TaxID=2109911 RepID=A0A4Q0U7N3_9BACT|nr:MAG: hypothetical protein C7K11_08050 [Candidatus Amulumruptor caecigallinarius]HJE38786.1 helix-turn-helix domain-containing protein [Candidatus Amulumruptor caecigallinarius]
MAVKKILLIIAVAVTLHAAASAAPQIPDSMLTERRLKVMVVENPDSVLRLLDVAEARRLPSLPQYRIDLLRALAYNELRMFSLKERYALKTLDDDSIEQHPHVRLNAMAMAVSASSFYGNYDRAYAMAMDAIELARDIGNKPGEYNILQSVADIAFDLGDREQGYAYLDEIITSGYASGNVRELANVSSALGAKVIQLYADDRYADALAESVRRMDVIGRIDSIGGAPPGFTDQQRAYTYARIASSAAYLGDSRRAAQAYDDFMATQYASTDYGRAFIVDYLLVSRRFDKVLEFTRPLYAVLQAGDTINDDYYGVLFTNAKAYSGLGDASRALSLMERASAIRDSLVQRERRSHAQELAAMFELGEKELALSQAREQSARRLSMLSVAVGAVVVAVIVLIALVAHYRVVLKRNRMAARQIDELMAQRSLLRGDAGYGEAPQSQEDYNRFAEMDRRIISDRLFLLPGCNRDMIADKCGLPKPAVSSLVQQFAHCSVGEYVCRLKVEYSVSLIKQHPDWTIEAIGYASGFNSRSTYYQHFNRVFGITPAQYASQQHSSKS